MKKFTLLLMSLLMVSILALAQIKMYLHFNDTTRVEYIASRVDSITFDLQIKSPDDSANLEDSVPELPIHPNKPKTTIPNSNKHEYIDLGLPSGTLWGTMNVGAQSPEDYGDYFSWGEKNTKNIYTPSNYTYLSTPNILPLSNDVANAKWGGDWCIPTKEDLDELRTECSWSFERKNGINGYTVLGPNGNSIFLPLAGYYSNSLYSVGSSGNYWCSTPNKSISDNSYYMYFYSGHVSWGDYRSRFYGLSVRPILHVEFIYNITFDSNGGEGTMQDIAIKNLEELRIPENKFTHSDLIFTGWNTKSDGTGITYKVGQSIAISENLTLYAQWEEKGEDIHNGYKYVDLGLTSGTLWATVNVGANYPEDYGNYYAWGEISTKYYFSEDNYEWNCNNYSVKYCEYDTYKTLNLDLSDDVAYVKWGGNWRMPTEAEFEELHTECTWTWVSRKSIKGYHITSNFNGNSIFLPAAGHRDYTVTRFEGSETSYWTSSLSSGSNSNGTRCKGRSVRPVLSGIKPTFTLTFDSNGGKGAMPAINGLYGDKVAIPEITFTNDKFSFAGWNTKADGSGTAYIGTLKYITLRNNTTLYAQWEESSGVENGYEYVNLGLPSGTKWATMNVGATSPEDYGDKFAWGETTTKSDFYSSDYTYPSSNSTILSLENDAANANWGGKWCMPTDNEQDELRNSSYTTWTWTTLNDVNGYEIKSKINGNSIFMPTSGPASIGYYWSSIESNSYYNNAYCLTIYNGGAEKDGSIAQYKGMVVRPILRETKPTYTMTFDSNGGEGSMTAINNLNGEQLIPASSTFTRNNYCFVGWNTKADGTGITYTGENQYIKLDSDITLYAQWAECSGVENGYEYVNLGLPSGTKWATMNVGATSPEGYGDKFAWGETNTTTNKSEDDYFAKNDIANSIWGGEWRMPTKDEQEELIKQCSWEWTTQYNVNGYIVKSKINGNSIFLPAAGYSYDVYSGGSYGYYWSISLNTDFGYYYNTNYAYYLYLQSPKEGLDKKNYHIYDIDRNFGLSVRPVLSK